MNTYQAGFNGKIIELQAESLWAAKQEAVKLFAPPKSQAHMVWVVLTETGRGLVSLNNSNADFG